MVADRPNAPAQSAGDLAMRVLLQRPVKSLLDKDALGLGQLVENLGDLARPCLLRNRQIVKRQRINSQQVLPSFGL